MLSTQFGRNYRVQGQFIQIPIGQPKIQEPEVEEYKLGEPGYLDKLFLASRR